MSSVANERSGKPVHAGAEIGMLSGCRKSQETRQPVDNIDHGGFGIAQNRSNHPEVVVTGLKSCAAQGGIMITVDLNARVLGEEHNVYVARPGKGYRLYREFRENSSLILELVPVVN